MQLFQNQKTFSEFFCTFPKSMENLKYFGKKDESQRFFVSEIINFKKGVYLNA